MKSEPAWLTRMREREPEWMTRGKSIQQLIRELQSFEDQQLEVRSRANGADLLPIQLVARSDGFCVLEAPTPPAPASKLARKAKSKRSARRP